MAKQFIGVRIEPDLKTQIDQVATTNGETTTDTITRALRTFLGGKTKKQTLGQIDQRLRRLEAIAKGSPGGSARGQPDPQPTPIDPEVLEDHITLQEAAGMVGCPIKTMKSLLVVLGITPVDFSGPRRSLNILRKRFWTPFHPSHGTHIRIV